MTTLQPGKSHHAPVFYDEDYPESPETVDHSFDRSLAVMSSPLENKEQLASIREGELLMLRGSIEVLWIEIGAVANDIIRNKLYRYRRDKDGNYFRTAKAYFAHLEEQFRERGWQLSRTTLYRFADDYQLFVDQLGLDPKTCQTLGKSALSALAPGVRKLLEEGEEGREQAVDLVQEVLAAVEANEGLPKTLVDDAVDEATGRVMKSVEIAFTRAAFGVKLKKLTLWWDGAPIDLTAGGQVTEDQARWLAGRLGNPFTV